MSGFPRPYGRYVLDERIAMGGMAEIFRARTATQGFEKKVCIKRILPHFLADADFVSMFRDEARTAAKLQHANVVQVFDFGEEDGTLYLAMELVDGADLRRVLETARKKKLALDVGAVIQIGIDVARGLHHAHTLAENGRPLGIVHRDISPHNILMSRAGEVKVTDFGIAKAAERSTHTGTGIVKGKVAYMAPEQAEGLAFDHRLDQFAVGIVLWEALCGERLFNGENEVTTLRKVLACDVPAPSSLRGTVPAALDEVLLRALAKDPAQRFSDMRAFELALSRVLYAGSLDPSSADLRTQFSRIMDGDAGPRRTLVADARAVDAEVAAAVAAAGLPQAAQKTVTESDPNLLGAVATGLSRTDQEARAQPSSDVSRVFTTSGKSIPARAADAASDQPPTVALDDPRAADPATSAPVAERSVKTKSASDLSLSAAAQAAEAETIPPPQDGTPATRTHVPRTPGASAALPNDVTADDNARAPAALLAAEAAAAPAPVPAPVGPRRNLRAAAIGGAAGLVLTAVIAGVVSRSDPAPTATSTPPAAAVAPAPATATPSPAPADPTPPAVAPPAAAPADLQHAAAVPVDAGVAQDKPEPEPAAAARTGAKKTGKLRLAFTGAVGWGHVSIDGAARGEVDEQKVFVLPVGKHKVRVQNPSAKLDREFTVEVSAAGVRSYNAVTGAFEGAR